MVGKQVLTKSGMISYKQFIAVFLLWVMGFQLSAQDRGEPENGNKLPCRLMEEKVNGQPAVRYEYDNGGRLISKLFVKQNYAEKYKYDDNGNLIEINSDVEPNAYLTTYTYEKGLLTSVIKKDKKRPIERVYRYGYNSAGELTTMTEYNADKEIAITQFKDGKVIKITDNFINYTTNERGLITKSTSRIVESPVNVYTYNEDDLLILKELYSEKGKLIMYTEYSYSPVKKAALNPIVSVANNPVLTLYKNPFGEDSRLLTGVTHYNTDFKVNRIVKVSEIKMEKAVDNTGKLLSEKSQNEERTYVYANCQN